MPDIGGSSAERGGWEPNETAFWGWDAPSTGLWDVSWDVSYPWDHFDGDGALAIVKGNDFELPVSMQNDLQETGTCTHIGLGMGAPHMSISGTWYYRLRTGPKPTGQWYMAGRQAGAG